MQDRSEGGFINEHARDLKTFWNRVSDQILSSRQDYQWPRGASLKGSIDTRAQLEQRIQNDLNNKDCLSKFTFDAVIQWGFGVNSGCSEQEVLQATRLAFCHLKSSKVAEAAKALVKLPRIGISRASKILALSDQLEFGIYDSRSAHGLSA